MGRTNRRGQTRGGGNDRNSSNNMYGKYIFGALAVVLVGLLVWVLVPSSNNKKGLTVNADTPAESVNPDKVNITLDFSASMQGYTSSADYTDLISYLKGWQPSKTNIWLGDSKYVQKGDKDDIITRLSPSSATPIEYKGASLLNNDIGRLAARAMKDSTLEIFVTDGILSGSDNQIHSASKWNYHHRLELSDSVRSALEPYDNIAASIYQFPTQFFGQYYDQENNHGTFNGKRYLYVVALGNAGNLAALKQEMSKLRSNGDISYSAEWHAIDRKPLSSNFSIENTTRKTGADNTEYYQIGKSKKDPKIRIEANAFCNNVTDSTFYAALADSTMVYMGGKRLTGIHPEYNSDYNEIRVDIPKGMVGNEQTFTVVIKRPTTQWIKECSTDDDSYILPNSGRGDKRKTFLLEYLIKGIQKGVNSSDTIYSKQFMIIK